MTEPIKERSNLSQARQARREEQLEKTEAQDGVPFDPQAVIDDLPPAAADLPPVTETTAESEIGK